MIKIATSFEDEEEGYAPKILYKWYFWILYYILTIPLLDLIFRLINTQYRGRTARYWQICLQQSYYLIGILALVFLTIYFYNKYVSIHKGLKAKLNVETEFNVFQKLGKPGYQIPMWTIAILSGLYPIAMTYLHGLPDYYPDNSFSYMAETIFLLLAILPNYLYVFSFAVGLLIVISIIQLPKKATHETIKLDFATEDKSGGFKPVGMLLFRLILAITFFCLAGLFMFYIMYLYGLKFISFSFNIPLLIILPILSFIFIFLFPQKNYHKLLKDLKKHKLDFVREKKNVLLSLTLFHDEVKWAKEDADKLNQYNLLINEIESISNWPLSYEKIYSLFIATLIPLVVEIIIRLLKI
jgi:hypothetical protein